MKYGYTVRKIHVHLIVTVLHGPVIEMFSLVFMKRVLPDPPLVWDTSHTGITGVSNYVCPGMAVWHLLIIILCYVAIRMYRHAVIRISWSNKNCL